MTETTTLAAPTEDELKALVQRAAELSPATWESVKAFATSLNQPLIEVAKELHTVLQEPYLQQVKDDAQRITFAIGVVQVRLQQASQSNAVEWDVTVFGYGNAKETSGGKPNRELWGIGKPVDDKTNGEQIVRVTFWEETIDIALGATPGKQYRVFLSGGFKDGIWQATADKTRTNWKTVTGDVTANLQDIVKKHFKMASLAKASDFYTKGFTDIVLIEGKIADRQTGTGNDGQWWRLSVMDNTMRSGQGQPATLFVDEVFTKYQTGSTFLYGVQIKAPKTGKENYGPQIFMSFAVPVIAIPAESPKLMQKAGTKPKGDAAAVASGATAKAARFSDF